MTKHCNTSTRVGQAVNLAELHRKVVTTLAAEVRPYLPNPTHCRHRARPSTQGWALDTRPDPRQRARPSTQGSSLNIKADPRPDIMAASWPLLVSLAYVASIDEQRNRRACDDSLTSAEHPRSDITNYHHSAVALSIAMGVPLSAAPSLRRNMTAHGPLRRLHLRSRLGG